ncbi:nucleoside ABC transporter [Cutibacterium acnes JCM 18920]|nr:nucleoside ABC transporter [Cutibacterium acnes JCM 18920]
MGRSQPTPPRREPWHEPASRFPRPTTSDITKTGIELPAEASEALDKELEFEQVESREARTHRLSTGVLIGIMALVLFILLTTTSGEARFAFTDALAGKELGTMSVSGFRLCSLALLRVCWRLGLSL